ncbi:hypothetical protein CDD83_1337 [Cordyceps sp. RAO-2017]|nr:hypothetical protein CDD83_1337 [Cordyceps sp. RAO-2017]
MSSPEPVQDPAAPEAASPHPPADAEGHDAQPGTGIEAQPKKKKAKPAARRGPTALPKNRGTGFEEYFADPPMTPEEAAEEKTQIYARDLPFEERIQACIQRFRSRRRLRERQALFFNEYLFLGGVDTSPNAFVGLDPKDLQGLTPAQRRDATAADAVHSGSAADDRFYHGDDEHWTVDFAGVVAGFLSTSLVTMTNSCRSEMESGTAVVENFLRYILHHEVCPEYEDDVGGALRLCADARNEWPLLDRLRASLPGPFHTAAAELFSTSNSRDWDCRSYQQPGDFDARAKFYSACALLGETSTLRLAARGADVGVVREDDCAIEVVEIEQPSQVVAQQFRRLHLGGKPLGMAPMGRVLFKQATIEDGWETPVVPMPVPDGAPGIWLYFDVTALADLRPGMKMALRLVELETGVTFVKSLLRIVPTYHSFLPQLLMKHYKRPRDDERPAASVHDPHAEDKQHDGETEA